MSESSNERILGSIKWFNPDKGFGFIQLPGGGMDIFVHVNQLRKSGINKLPAEGDKILFSTQSGPKGAFAVDLSLVEAPEALPK